MAGSMTMLLLDLGETPEELGIVTEEDDDNGSAVLADELDKLFKLLLDSNFLLDDETFTLELDVPEATLDEETFVLELDLTFSLEDNLTIEDDDKAELDFGVPLEDDDTVISVSHSP